MPIFARIEGGHVIDIFPRNLGPDPLTLDGLPVVPRDVRIDPAVPHWRDVTGCADVRVGSVVNALGEVAPPSPGWVRQFRRAAAGSDAETRE